MKTELSPETPPAPVSISSQTADSLRQILESPYGPRVIEFMSMMVDKLNRNAHKGSWEGCSADFIFFKMIDEVVEVRKAIRDGEPRLSQLFECADVANFAFIMWDIIEAGEKDIHGRRPDDPEYGNPLIPVKPQSFNTPYEG